MEMIYNELSSLPKFANTNIANEQIACLIKTYAKAKIHKFNKIRFFKNLHEVEVCENYTFFDWLNTTSQKNLKDLLLEARAYPFIADEDEEQIDEYINHKYFYENLNCNFEQTECMGLAAAHIYDTLSIGLSQNDLWKINRILITKVKDDEKIFETCEIKNVYSPTCFDDKMIADYISSLGEITLLKTELLPKDKKVHLSTHHGLKELSDFSKRLILDDFIIEIKSTDWGGKKFIRRIFNDGIIEIVLINTERKYALRVQTTGRNYRETFLIAKHIEHEYSL